MSDRSNWPMRVFKTPEEGQAYDDDFYARLTPEERIAMMFEIIGDNDPEPKMDRTSLTVTRNQV